MRASGGTESSGWAHLKMIQMAVVRKPLVANSCLLSRTTSSNELKAWRVGWRWAGVNSRGEQAPVAVSL